MERLKKQMEFIVEVDKVKKNHPPDLSGRCEPQRGRRGAFLASRSYGGAPEGIFQRGGGSGKGYSHGSDPRSC